MVLDGKSLREYLINAGVPHGFMLHPTLFLLYINDFTDDVICNIAIYADDITLSLTCDQAPDKWQELETEALWTGVGSGLLISMLEKWMCLFLRKNHAASLEPLAHHQKVAGLSFFFNQYFVRCSSELAQLVLRPVIKENTTRVIAARQNNVLLIWRTILNRTP